MSSAPQHFDAIIIGSGQAGVPLAIALAQSGKHVAIIEKAHFGGTCLNTGCTPTKAYVASARAAWAARNAPKLGVEISGQVQVNLKAVKERKDRLVGISRKGLAQTLEQNPRIGVIRGSALFSRAKAVQVNGITYTAEQVFINVGARPRIPQGFETVKCYTNWSILQLEALPKRLIIIGGSYIGLEFAQMFRRFGSEVTIVEKNERLIAKEDVQTSDAIAGIMENEGVKLELNTSCISAKPYGDGVEVLLSCAGEKKRIRGSHVLAATGRQSNADLLALHNAGIAHNEHSQISVNEQLETNIQGIYALGDCNGEGAFTHTSVNDFEIVSQNLLHGADRKLSDRYVNYALYTDPPMGRAGMSRGQALEAGYSILYGYMAMENVARAKEKGETQGFMEVVIDAETERILGATVLGVGGDEVIAVFLTAMYADAPYTALRDSVQTHPTVAELIPTMLKDLKRIAPKT